MPHDPPPLPPPAPPAPDPHARTGRTHRLLLEAINQAQAGQAVLVVGANTPDAMRMMDVAREILGDAGIPFRLSANRRLELLARGDKAYESTGVITFGDVVAADVDWVTCGSRRGGGPGGPVLIDHHAVEQHLAAALAMMHRFDPPPPYAPHNPYPAVRADYADLATHGAILYRRLDPGRRARAEAVIRAAIDFPEHAVIRTAIACHGPSGWIHEMGGMGGGHHGFGTAIRNRLRACGLGEDGLGLSNLDDVYVPLIEGALGFPPGAPPLRTRPAPPPAGKGQS